MIKVKVHLAESTSFTSKPVSGGIKLMQGMYLRRPAERRYNHYALEVNGIIYQAVFSGVEAIPVAKFLEGYKIKKTFQYTIPFEITDYKFWFSKYDGDKYDFLQIVGIFLRRISSIKFRIGKKDRSLICNEVAILFINRFIEHVVDIKMIDKYDLIMTEKIIDRHVEEGKCIILKDWDKTVPKIYTSVLDDYVGA